MKIELIHDSTGTYYLVTIKRFGWTIFCEGKTRRIAKTGALKMLKSRWDSRHG